MFEKFIVTYGDIQHRQEISNENLETIKQHLPEDLFVFLQKGKGSYMDGFLWIVNPIEYKDIVDEVYLPLQNPSICFARDAFGNLYLWEDNSIIFVDINHSKQEVVGRKATVFFDLKMTDKGFLEKRLPYNNFLEAKNILGELQSDECYGYQHLLGMGGSEKITNLKKIKVKEYISITAQALGKIQ
ncbi:DUF1851 domain-containing protein [Chryseobacterium ginsengisoli]|uniref:DUF1851 domain-containing protein n=1 Tax=Chryseobacterium ginsengisoli TaxID=363853 RepID=A0ABP9M125_9FLAO